MRVWFAGGGTGGHLYPALAIAGALARVRPDARPLFIGARRGLERVVLPQQKFPFVLLDLHPLYRSRFWRNWHTLAGLLSSWRQLSELARSEHPAAVVATGGYAAAPALLYAVARRIPIVLQEQNSVPGVTTRFFSRFARQIHLGFPEAARWLKPARDAVVRDSGSPVEPPPESRDHPAKARAKWGFADDGSRVLLVFGGSQGARAVNAIVADWVRRGIPPGLYLIWSTGAAGHPDYASLESDRVRVRPFISPMADAYAAADFAVARAGAMSTAELCAWGIPMVLIPLPTAAADHQTANARALEAAGAATVIPQNELTVERLDAAVRALLGDAARLARMATAAAARARARAAADIARDIAILLPRP